MFTFELTQPDSKKLFNMDRAQVIGGFNPVQSHAYPEISCFQNLHELRSSLRYRDEIIHL